MAPFRIDGYGLERLFDLYEAQRGRLGDPLRHVSPRQRLDAVEVCCAAYVSGRAPADGDARGWLRFLRPVLAETRESAQALAAAFEALLDDGGQGGDRLDPLPGWRDRLRWQLRASWHGRQRMLPWLLAVVAAGVVLCALRFVVPLVSTEEPAVPVQRPAFPEGGDVAVVPAPVTMEYPSVLRTTATAARQYSDALTPRMLAEILSQELWSAGGTGAMLATFTRLLPFAPDQPIPRSPAGAARLRQYAAVAAALAGGRDVGGAMQAAAQAGQAPVVATGRGRLVDPVDWFGQPDASVPRPVVAAGALQDAPRWPWWVRGLPFLALLPASVWAFRGWASLRQQDMAARRWLRVTRPDEAGRPMALQTAPVALPPLPVLPRAVRRIAALREPRPGTTLDAPRSLRATLAAGGVATVRMLPATRSVEFVFLLRRQHPNDHEFGRSMRLLDALRAAGVVLAVYEYGPDPRTVRHPATGAGLDGRGLLERHAGAALVLMTDGQELIDPFTQAPYAFVRRLRGWPRRMLLTPVPVRDWGERELRLAAALDAPVGRATAAGLADLGLAITADSAECPARAVLAKAMGHTGFAERIDAWRRGAAALLALDPAARRPLLLGLDDHVLLRGLPPPPGEPGDRELGVKPLIVSLQQWLGPGFVWFAACAVYPQLRFDVTLWLGQVLPHPHQGKATLFDEARLAQLALLPWFRRGHMPGWLRAAAFEALTPAQRVQAQNAVDRLLDGLPGAGQGLRLPAWLPGAAQRPVPADEVMLDCLKGTERTSVLLRDGARATREAWLTQAASRLGLAAAGAWGAWLLWPTSDAAAPFGAWWPLVVYVAAWACCAAVAALRSARGLPAAG